jgi:hypothetical protein
MRVNDFTEFLSLVNRWCGVGWAIVSLEPRRIDPRLSGQEGNLLVTNPVRGLARQEWKLQRCSERWRRC